MCPVHRHRNHRMRVSEINHHFKTMIHALAQASRLSPRDAAMKTYLRSSTPAHASMPDSNLFAAAQGTVTGTLNGCLGSLDGPCIEKLLLHCAAALEANDSTLVQQVMWVLNNIASAHGEPNQRLTSCFLHALVSRASRLCPTATVMPFPGSAGSASGARSMTVTELVGYVDLIPWNRFGFTASNGAILEAVQGRTKVHVLDFGIYYCVQWPTLIDALAKRPEGPPLLRITVPAARPPVPPFLNVPTEEVGHKLANFALSRNVQLEFHILEPASTWTGPSFLHELSSCLLDPSSLGLKEDEALVVNCQGWLRYLPAEEPDAPPVSSRDGFLELIHGLNPCIVTVTDEDADLDAARLSSRMMACFNYLWIPFDALETFLSKDSPQRMEYEADIGWKIENILGSEGAQRMERLESGGRLAARMTRAGFAGLAFEEETVREVKVVLDEHASGWGMKQEEDALVLTWKGHNAVFTTAWVPTRFDV